MIRRRARAGTPRRGGRWAGSHPSQSIVRNTPVEVRESRTGMRIERLELRAGGYSAGARRGGPGLRRDIRFTSPGEFLTIAKKTKSPPWSVGGGPEAAPTRLPLNHGTASARRLGTSRTAVAPGDRVCIENAGGAGHGSAKERPCALAEADLADRFATPEKTRGDEA